MLTKFFCINLEIGAPLNEVQASPGGRLQEGVQACEDQKFGGSDCRRGSRDLHRPESAGGGRVSRLLRRPHPTERDRQKVLSPLMQHILLMLRLGLIGVWPLVETHELLHPSKHQASPSMDGRGRCRQSRPFCCPSPFFLLVRLLPHPLPSREGGGEKEINV